MIKKIWLLAIASIFSIGVHAQILDPVKWTTRIEKVADDEYKLFFDAVIEDQWHMYSQFTPDNGPLPLEFIYNNQEGNYEPIGKATESEYQVKFDETFEVDVYSFQNNASFSHNIKITNPNNTFIQVELFYQACIDMCINQSKFFEFDIKNLTAKEVKGFADLSSEETSEETTSEVATVEAPKEERGIWNIFIWSFLGGFAALLTPCVFPMIPMTVSFFTKQSKSRAKGIKNALIYGISIIVIYVVLGLLVTRIFGADSLNALSTNVVFNVVFFLILVVFAVSFLGAFEIMLPNSWANKIDRQADRGGLIGIFFMALALAVVSFSCTGPIVGTLLVEAASKGGLAPLIGMLGFSSALALPFMLFALFPGWLNSLPRSGGWMNSVKVSLGFLELALALKFLSNADLVLQLGWLEREVFIALWIAIFGAWAMYLFGKLQLPHDSPIANLSVGRALFAIIVSAFTIYMIPGLWGAPLKLLSGLTPPLTYAESPKGVGGGGAASIVELPAGAKEGPNGMIAFTDYETGMAYAKEVNKPVLLDFTGYACVNCRKMEDHVWSDSKILPTLKNEIVLISLYVDDKKLLPESEQYVSKTTGQRIKSVGNKWSDFQIEHYQANAQPYYIILDSDGNRLNEPVGYTPDVDEYAAWLEGGIANYKK